MSVEEILHNARGHDAGPGCVSELHLKHLLALNLRKLNGAEVAFAPRSYILQEGNHMDLEIARFVLDFKVSRALAIILHVTGQRQRPVQESTPGDMHTAHSHGSGLPEGLWGRELPEIEWEPGPDKAFSSSEAVFAALAVAERAIQVCWPTGMTVTDEEWAMIRIYDTTLAVHPEQDAFKERCEAILEATPSHLQLPLLRHNFWALKPSCGQFGRGILLMDRLPTRPAQLLEWAACVGRGGQKGCKDITQGCVLQKLIECPHLLDKAALDSGEANRPSVAAVLPPSPSLKYNLRMIVLATLRLPCRIWLYKHGFVSLALRSYTDELDPLSHITNLRQGPGNDNQRRWPLEDLNKCLQAEGKGSFDSVLLPQIKRIVLSLFRALASQPCSLLPLEGTQELSGSGSRSASGRKLRRFGIDFLVDENLAVWLLEVNFLKNGYALGHAQSGAAGDSKRAFVDQFIADETLLRTAVASQAGGCDEMTSSFEELLPLKP